MESNQNNFAAWMASGRKMLVFQSAGLVGDDVREKTFRFSWMV